MKSISQKLTILFVGVSILSALSGCGSVSTPVVSVVTTADSSESGASAYSYYRAIFSSFLSLFRAASRSASLCAVS